jgi:hypothetical protein
VTRLQGRVDTQTLRLWMPWPPESCCGRGPQREEATWSRDLVSAVGKDPQSGYRNRAIILSCRPPRRVWRERHVEPGARTAWHTHPLGIARVTSGAGRAQRWGGPSRRFGRRCHWIPPGEKHWHGAAPTTAMTHRHPRKLMPGAVDWLEHVPAEQYEGRSRVG